MEHRIEPTKYYYTFGSNEPAFHVKPGDTIVVKEKSRKVPQILEAMETVVRRGIPTWIEVDKEKFQGTLTALPNREEFTIPIQEQFNDEIFDACRRFITWDMERIEIVARPYANQHQCVLKDIVDGWYRIPSSHCPQNYGYNGIKLKVPATGTNVVLNFKGIAGTEGYSAVKTDKAGWRYGFLASLKDGSRVYGNVGKNPQDAAAFQVPENTQYLWLVVMGAPTEHWSVSRGRRRRGRSGGGGSGGGRAEWPYQIKLSGTTIDEAFIE